MCFEREICVNHAHFWKFMWPQKILIHMRPANGVTLKLWSLLQDPAMNMDGRFLQTETVQKRFCSK